MKTNNNIKILSSIHNNDIFDFVGFSTINDRAIAFAIAFKDNVLDQYLIYDLSFEFQPAIKMIYSAKDKCFHTFSTISFYGFDADERYYKNLWNGNCNNNGLLIP